MGRPTEDIAFTITNGIRNGGDQARDLEMPRFGADQILTREQVADVVAYLRSLAGQNADAEAAARGQPVFAENRAACHGENGAGMPEMVPRACGMRSGSMAPRTRSRWPRSGTRATA